MTMNFADIANKKIDDIERPPLAPIGTYRWQITKLPTVNTSQDNLWDFLTIPVKVVEAFEDVDVTEYNGDITSVVSRVQFVFNKSDQTAFDQTLFRVRTFLEKHVGCASAGDSINAALNNSIGQQFIGSFNHRPNKNNPEEIFGEITKTAPLD